MLVLTRNNHESIIIGEGENAIKVAFLGISREDPNQARIGIEAPRHIPIVREELLKRDRTAE